MKIYIFVVLGLLLLLLSAGCILQQEKTGSGVRVWDAGCCKQVDSSSSICKEITPSDEINKLYSQNYVFKPAESPCWKKTLVSGDVVTLCNLTFDNSTNKITIPEVGVCGERLTPPVCGENCIVMICSKDLYDLLTKEPPSPVTPADVKEANQRNLAIKLGKIPIRYTLKTSASSAYSLLGKACSLVKITPKTYKTIKSPKNMIMSFRVGMGHNASEFDLISNYMPFSASQCALNPRGFVDSVYLYNLKEPYTCRVVGWNGHDFVNASICTSGDCTECTVDNCDVNPDFQFNYSWDYYYYCPNGRAKKKLFINYIDCAFNCNGYGVTDKRASTFYPTTDVCRYYRNLNGSEFASEVLNYTDGLIQPEIGYNEEEVKAGNLAVPTLGHNLVLTYLNDPDFKWGSFYAGTYRRGTLPFECVDNEECFSGLCTYRFHARAVGVPSQSIYEAFSSSSSPNTNAIKEQGISKALTAFSHVKDIGCFPNSKGELFCPSDFAEPSQITTKEEYAAKGEYPCIKLEHMPVREFEAKFGGRVVLPYFYTEPLFHRANAGYAASQQGDNEDPVDETAPDYAMIAGFRSAVTLNKLNDNYEVYFYNLTYCNHAEVASEGSSHFEPGRFVTPAPIYKVENVIPRVYFAPLHINKSANITIKRSKVLIYNNFYSITSFISSPKSYKYLSGFNSTPSNVVVFTPIFTNTVSFTTAQSKFFFEHANYTCTGSSGNELNHIIDCPRAYSLTSKPLDNPDPNMKNSLFYGLHIMFNPSGSYNDVGGISYYKLSKASVNKRYMLEMNTTLPGVYVYNPSGCHISSFLSTLPIHSNGVTCDKWYVTGDLVYRPIIAPINLDSSGVRPLLLPSSRKEGCEFNGVKSNYWKRVPDEIKYSKYGVDLENDGFKYWLINGNYLNYYIVDEDCCGGQADIGEEDEAVPNIGFFWRWQNGDDNAWQAGNIVNPLYAYAYAMGNSVDTKVFTLCDNESVYFDTTELNPYLPPYFISYNLGADASYCNRTLTVGISNGQYLFVPMYFTTYNEHIQNRPLKGIVEDVVNSSDWNTFTTCSNEWIENAYNKCVHETLSKAVADYSCDESTLNNLASIAKASMYSSVDGCRDDGGDYCFNITTFKNNTIAKFCNESGYTSSPPIHCSSSPSCDPERGENCPYSPNVTGICNDMENNLSNIITCLQDEAKTNTRGSNCDATLTPSTHEDIIDLGLYAIYMLNQTKADEYYVTEPQTAVGVPLLPLSDDVSFLNVFTGYKNGTGTDIPEDERDKWWRWVLEGSQEASTNYGFRLLKNCHVLNYTPSLKNGEEGSAIYFSPDDMPEELQKYIAFNGSDDNLQYDPPNPSWRPNDADYTIHLAYCLNPIIDNPELRSLYVLDNDYEMPEACKNLTFDDFCIRHASDDNNICDIYAPAVWVVKYDYDSAKLTTPYGNFSTLGDCLVDDEGKPVTTKIGACEGCSYLNLDFTNSSLSEIVTSKTTVENDEEETEEFYTYLGGKNRFLYELDSGILPLTFPDSTDMASISSSILSPSSADDISLSIRGGPTGVYVEDAETAKSISKWCPECLLVTAPSLYTNVLNALTPNDLNTRPIPQLLLGENTVTLSSQSLADSVNDPRRLKGVLYTLFNDSINKSADAISSRNIGVPVILKVAFNASNSSDLLHYPDLAQLFFMDYRGDIANVGVAGLLLLPSKGSINEIVDNFCHYSKVVKALTGRSDSRIVVKKAVVNMTLPESIRGLLEAHVYDTRAGMSIPTKYCINNTWFENSNHTIVCYLQNPDATKPYPLMKVFSQKELADKLNTSTYDLLAPVIATAGRNSGLYVCAGNYTGTNISSYTYDVLTTSAFMGEVPIAMNNGSRPWSEPCYNNILTPQEVSKVTGKDISSMDCYIRKGDCCPSYYTGAMLCAKYAYYHAKNLSRYDKHGNLIWGYYYDGATCFYEPVNTSCDYTSDPSCFYQTYNLEGSGISKSGCTEGDLSNSGFADKSILDEVCNTTEDFSRAVLNPDTGELYLPDDTKHSTGLMAGTGVCEKGCSGKEYCDNETDPYLNCTEYAECLTTTANSCTDTQMSDKGPSVPGCIAKGTPKCENDGFYYANDPVECGERVCKPRDSANEFFTSHLYPDLSKLECFPKSPYSGGIYHAEVCQNTSNLVPPNNSSDPSWTNSKFNSLKGYSIAVVNPLLDSNGLYSLTPALSSAIRNVCDVFGGGYSYFFKYGDSTTTDPTCEVFMSKDTSQSFWSDVNILHNCEEDKGSMIDNYNRPYSTDNHIYGVCAKRISYGSSPYSVCYNLPRKYVAKYATSGSLLGLPVGYEDSFVCKLGGSKYTYKNDGKCYIKSCWYEQPFNLISHAVNVGTLKSAVSITGLEARTFTHSVSITLSCCGVKRHISEIKFNIPYNSPLNTFRVVHDGWSYSGHTCKYYSSNCGLKLRYPTIKFVRKKFPDPPWKIFGHNVWTYIPVPKSVVSKQAYIGFQEHHDFSYSDMTRFIMSDYVLSSNKNGDNPLVHAEVDRSGNFKVYEYGGDTRYYCIGSPGGYNYGWEKGTNYCRKLCKSAIMDSRDTGLVPPNLTSFSYACKEFKKTTNVEMGNEHGRLCGIKDIPGLPLPLNEPIYVKSCHYGAKNFSTICAGRGGFLSPKVFDEAENIDWSNEQIELNETAWAYVVGDESPPPHSTANATDGGTLYIVTYMDFSDAQAKRVRELMPWVGAKFNYTCFNKNKFLTVEDLLCGEGPKMGLCGASKPTEHFKLPEGNNSLHSPDADIINLNLTEINQISIDGGCQSTSGTEEETTSESSTSLPIDMPIVHVKSFTSDLDVTTFVLDNLHRNTPLLSLIILTFIFAFKRRRGLNEK